MPHKDPKKAKAYRQKYKAANKDKIAAYQKEYMKGYLERNPQPYQSTTTLEWAIKRRELSTEDFRLWQRDKRNRLVREKYARNKAIIDGYKSSHPCQCGEDDIACLEFHHRDESTKKFAISAGKKETIEKLNAEIDKCDVLCKNCHTKLHNKDIINIDYNEKLDTLIDILATKLDKKERRKIYAGKQKTLSRMLVRDYKIENNCKNCGEEDSNCLAFHHRDGVEKEGNIAQLYKYGIKKVQREIDKCDLLCHNCHSKHHHS